MIRRLVALALLASLAPAQDPPAALAQARARNAALKEEQERTRAMVDEVTARRKARATDVADAQKELELVTSWYAADTPDYDRPSTYDVTTKLETLQARSDRDQLEDELAQRNAERARYESRRAEIDETLRALDETFARLREEADDGTTAELERLRDERQSTLTVLRGRYTELLKENATLRESATLEHNTLRRAFLYLREKNIWLRGKSDLTVEAVQRAVEDAALLPGWFADAVAAVGAYIVDHRGALARLGGLVIAALVVLLVVRRLLRSRHAEARQGTANRHIFRTLGHLFLPVAIAFLLWLLPFGAALVLPRLPSGVERLLESVAWLLGAWWLAQAAVHWLRRPRRNAEGEEILPPEGAARLAFGLRLLTWISLIALPPVLALEHLGYDNPGALEGLWLLYKILIGLVVIAVLLRRRFLESLVPPEPGRGGRLALVAIRYFQPLLVLLVPALIVLDGLRYDILAGLITRFSVAAVVTIIAGGLLYRFARSATEAWLEKTFRDASETHRTAATDLVQYALGVTFLLFAIWGFLRLSGSDLAELKSFFDAPLPFFGDSERPVTWWKVVTAFVLLVLFLRGVRPTRRGVRELVLTRTKMDEGLRYTVSTLLGYVLFVIAIFVSLQQVLDLSSLGYLVAALGVGIGFGLQEIVSNFVSGLILLFERPLKVGDMVEVDDKVGIVRRINIRATTVLTLDNVYVLVPNREFITKTVVNYAHEDPKMRIHVGVGVSYGSDTNQVRDILMEVGKNHKNALDRPAPRVRFLGFGNSSLDFELLVWIRTPQQQYDVGTDLRFEILDAFREHGVEIPFPQRDLHVRSIVPELATSPPPPSEDAPSEEGA